MVSSFVTTLSEAVDEHLAAENVDGTYEIEAERFSLTFTLSEDTLEIRSIDTRGGEAGTGRNIIEAIHEFADEHGLDVKASNVLDNAQGFWERMGYEAGTTPEEYFRA